jgi:anti-sigma factor RsiW
VDCQSVFERLSADLDGELPPAEAAAVHRHIETCADCLRTRSQLEKARSAFRAIALEPVGDNFDDGVFRRLREGHRLRWWLPAVAGAAAVLGIVLLLRAPRPAPGNVAGPHSLSLTALDIPAGLIDGAAEAAADCARSGAVVCYVETPCADGRCRSAIVAAFTDIH